MSLLHFVNCITTHLCTCVGGSRQPELKAQYLARSLSRIHQLPHLETIHLIFYPWNLDLRSLKNARCLAFQTDVLNALAFSFRVHVQPNLVSLSLHNLRLSELEVLEYPAFQTVLTSLQCLQVSVITKCLPQSQIAKHLWSTL